MEKQIQYSLSTVLKAAYEISVNKKHFFIGIEHLFAAMIELQNSLCSLILRELTINKNDFFERIMDANGKRDGNPPWEDVIYTPRCDEIVGRLKKRIKNLNEASDQSILDEIITEGNSIPIMILFHSYGKNLKTIKEAIEIIKSNHNLHNHSHYCEKALNHSFPESHEHHPAGVYQYSRTPELNKFARDLVALSIEGSIQPAYGREEIINRIQRIFLRKSKNNPLLIGDAGVGKTAIVEGLAYQIANGTANDFLQGKLIFDINLSLLITGTQYRGQLEENLEKVLHEARNKENKVILFIDEIHTIIGTGNSPGSLDIANLLKPALARGEVSLIGATTYDEYRKYIEHDSALARRFQIIHVKEPSLEETEIMLLKIAKNLEHHHGCDILPEAVSSTIKLTHQYILDRRFPDKAIDILDEACSLVRTEKDKKRKQKVDSDSVRKVISEIIGVPLSDISKNEKHTLSKLKSNLTKRIINQEKAINAIVRATVKGRLGLKRGKRPLGVFLFTGHSGVGKTETAKAIAYELFGSNESLIQFNMSEYSLQSDITKLIGSSPGYVGYMDGGRLTESIRKKPYSVIVLDEIEKAHPEVSNVLLQAFEEGRLEDSKGRIADCQNVIFIMTANIVAQDTNKRSNIGFIDLVTESDSLNEQVKTNIMRFFKPEFINRIDEIVYFNTLTAKDLGKIYDIVINDCVKSIEHKGVKMEISPDVKEHIVMRACRENMGARPIRRLIESEIVDQLSLLLIGDLCEKESPVRFYMRDNKVVFGTL